MFRDPWVLLAYDRDTHRTREVARAGGDDTPTAPGGTVPFLAEGRVYWQAAERTGDEDRPARAHVYSRDLAGTTPVRREASDVSDLSVDGHVMFYVTSRFTDPDAPAGEARIHRRDLRSGQDEIAQVVRLGAGERLTQLASSGDDVAWIVRATSAEDETRESSVLTLRQADGTVTTFGAPDLPLADPVVTPDLVAWTGGDGGGQWLFDRRRRVVVELGVAPGLASVHGAGTHVVWREPDRWRTATLTTP
jgi:hypothetical protein